MVECGILSDQNPIRKMSKVYTSIKNYAALQTSWNNIFKSVTSSFKTYWKFIFFLSFWNNFHLNFLYFYNFGIGVISLNQKPRENRSERRSLYDVIMLLFMTSQEKTRETGGESVTMYSNMCQIRKFMKLQYVNT